MAQNDCPEALAKEILQGVSTFKAKGTSPTSCAASSDGNYIGLEINAC